MSASISIRPLLNEDFPEWLPLWVGNNGGGNDEEVTAETWSRIISADHPVNGLGAYSGKKLVGILHYVLHHTTGFIEPVCYMQDVYVPDEMRQKGIGKKLVKNLITQAKQNNWGRVYWLAQESNEAAGALYKDIGVKIDFNVYIYLTNNT